MAIRLSIAASVALSAPAYAYTDPGSGSLLLQLLLAAFTGVAFWLKSARRRPDAQPHRDESRPEADSPEG